MNIKTMDIQSFFSWHAIGHRRPRIILEAVDHSQTFSISRVDRLAQLSEDCSWICGQHTVRRSGNNILIID